MAIPPKQEKHMKKKFKKAKETKDAKSGAERAKAAEPLTRKRYEKELEKLQVELCHLQNWVVAKGLRVIVVFEGRDAAGKGGSIKRITERVSPRVFRVVALPAPTDKEKTQLYAQRYIGQFPSAGEVVLFDRSWYNRAGVERVMNFCSDEQYERFLKSTPFFEKQMAEEGIILIKYFFEVSQEVQEKRFAVRAKDPRRHWKLSPMDLQSWARWWDYTKAYDRMIRETDTKWAPWYRVPSNNKRSARLNCISHLLSVIPYKEIPFELPKLPRRRKRGKGVPDTLPFRHTIPELF
jgi:polyphosphate kinase 2